MGDSVLESVCDVAVAGRDCRRMDSKLKLADLPAHLPHESLEAQDIAEAVTRVLSCSSAFSLSS